MCGVLQHNFPDVPIEAVASTTAAAVFVAEHPAEPVAAIASKEAAHAYGLFIQEKISRIRLATKLVFGSCKKTQTNRAFSMIRQRKPRSM